MWRSAIWPLYSILAASLPPWLRSFLIIHCLQINITSLTLIVVPKVTYSDVTSAWPRSLVSCAAVVPLIQVILLTVVTSLLSRVNLYNCRYVGNNCNSVQYGICQGIRIMLWVHNEGSAVIRFIITDRGDVIIILLDKGVLPLVFV